MIVRMGVMLVLVVLLVLGLGYTKYHQITVAMGQAWVPLPESVSALTAAEESWNSQLSAIGALAPFQGVTVSAESVGKVARIVFESGATVQKGDLLAQLDVAVEEAQLKSAQAQLEWMRVSVDRSKSLREEEAVSQSEFDEASAKFKQAQAEVDSLKATITRKTIVAPFTGRLGIRQIQLGQYLAPGAPIVILQSLDPIYVNFALPQQQIGLVHAGQPVEVTVDAFPGKIFKGSITTISPEIDSGTRNIQLQATLPNKEETLRAGMFTSVHILLEKSDKAVILPLTAIQFAPYGDSVFIVESMKDPNGVEYQGVRQQFVKLGPTRGDQVAVLEGIKAGESVATSGLFKLRPKAAVKINNEVQPANAPDPKPVDK